MVVGLEIFKNYFADDTDKFHHNWIIPEEFRKQIIGRHLQAADFLV